MIPPRGRPPGVEIALASKGKPSRALSRATSAQMLPRVAEVTPQVDVGLGLFLEHHGAVLYFGHDGADEGFQVDSRADRVRSS